MTVCLNGTSSQHASPIYHSFTEEVHFSCQLRAMHYQFPSIFPGSGAEIFVEKRLGTYSTQTLNYLERLNQIPPKSFGVPTKTSPSQPTSIQRSAFDLHLCTWLVVAPSPNSPYLFERTGTKTGRKPYTEERESPHFRTTALTPIYNAQLWLLLQSQYID